MDSYGEDRRAMEKVKEFGIPTHCPCGERIVDEVSPDPKYQSCPGKTYLTCRNYTDDGKHFRQPCVKGLQEEVQSLVKKVNEISFEITKLQINECVQKTKFEELEKWVEQLMQQNKG